MITLLHCVHCPLLRVLCYSPHSSFINSGNNSPAAIGPCRVSGGQGRQQACHSPTVLVAVLEAPRQVARSASPPSLFLDKDVALGRGQPRQSYLRRRIDRIMVVEADVNFAGQKINCCAWSLPYRRGCQVACPTCLQRSGTRLGGLPYRHHPCMADFVYQSLPQK